MFTSLVNQTVFREHACTRLRVYMHDISFTVSNLAPRQIIMSFQVRSRSVSSAWDTVQVIVTML